ncbi:MAG: hypothetical protein FWB75_00090 [Oscillospiraceae bacterium]|nr:hypothetical protein [Oscillospiraceae bacterium]
MLRKLKSLLAIVMMLILAFSSITVLAADDDDDDETPDVPAGVIATQAAINKTLQLPIGTEIPGATFEFLVEKISVDEVSTPEALASMPELNENNLTIAFSPADKETNTTNNITYVVKESGDIFEGVTFPHAGIFVYEITEKKDTNPPIDSNAPHEVLTYSDAKYTITVYVGYDDGGKTIIKGIGTRVTVADNGTPGDGSKVDPTPGGNGEDYIFSQMVFNNTFVKTNGADNKENPDPTKDSESTLSVEKLVTGDFASREQSFDFTISLEVPVLVTDVPDFYRAYIVENGTVIDPKDNVDGVAMGEDAGGKYIEISTSGETAFKLKHSQKLVFVDTPVGTGYEVTEGAATNYIPSYIVTTDNVTGSNVTGEMSTELSTGDQLVGESVNSANFTNNRESVTPTGLNLNDLPFIGLIALAIASLIVFIAVKSRKRKTVD